MSSLNKKTRLIMMILCIVIGLNAMAVAIVAVAKREYIIFTAMLLVAIWQIFIFRKWKKCA